MYRTKHVDLFYVYDRSVENGSCWQPLSHIQTYIEYLNKQANIDMDQTVFLDHYPQYLAAAPKLLHVWLSRFCWRLGSMRASRGHSVEILRHLDLHPMLRNEKWSCVHGSYSIHSVTECRPVRLELRRGDRTHGKNEHLGTLLRGSMRCPKDNPLVAEKCVHLESPHLFVTQVGKLLRLQTHNSIHVHVYERLCVNSCLIPPFIHW